MNFYSVREAAEKLKMSVPWMRQKIFKKEIRYLKIGRRVFIPETTIADILKRSVVEPINKKGCDV